MTYTTCMSCGPKLQPSSSTIRRRVICAGAGLALVVTFEMPARTAPGGDRVRFQWDWATQPMRSGQAAKTPQLARTRQPLVSDFSSRHVFFPESAPASRMGALQKDTRFWQQYLHRHAHRFAQPFPSWNEVPDPNAGQEVMRDWSFSLANGNGGTISMPAKYSFNINAAPSCTNDFVVTGVNIAGSTTQANLVGLNSLYNTPSGNGLCAGTAPKVMFSYNIGGGVLNSYIALSLDGTKIAFNENNASGTSYFHVLKWATGTGNGTTAALPARPGIGNTAVDTKIALSGGVSTAPYIDYDADVAYVTTADNVVHKYGGVFTGTPTEIVTGGWPVATNVTGLSTPIYDSVSEHVFFVDSSSGGVNYIDDSVSPVTLAEHKFHFAPGISVAAPVMIDSGSQKIYAFSANPGGTSAVVAQADTNLSAASQVTVDIGSPDNSLVALMGDFNESYYNGDSTNARMYVIGNDGTTNKVPALYALSFTNAFKLNVTPANGPVRVATNTAGLAASTVTAFYNTSLSKQFIFFGVSGSCSTAVTTGCIRSVDVTNNAFPTATSVNNVIFGASGGTGSISIDNVSLSSGASSVYYTTMTGKTVVKVSQATLQ
jgi:hypothetical protein